MDLLGKEGKQAKEEVEKVSEQLKYLESHLNAVDTALQDFIGKSQDVLEETYRMEQQEVEKLSEIDEVEEKIKEDEGEIEYLEREIERIRDDMEKMREVQRKNQQKINALMDSELLDIIGRVRKFINTTNKRHYNLREALKSLENRLNQLENDFIMEVNSRDFDFDKKLDQKRFEDRDEEVEEELKKLRASINVLADEMDKKDEIEVE